MDWWEQRRAHLLSRPAAEGLAAMAAAVDPRARVVRARRMGGGLATATTAVDLRRPSGAMLRLVVKRYMEGDETPPLEWERLCYAQRLPVPTPEPVALDAAGEWFGAPALVMRRLDGRADHSEPGADRRLAQIASTLVAIEGGPRKDLPEAMRRRRRLEPPADLKPGLAERAVAAAGRHLDDALRARRVIGHSDFHPGNLLWRRGALTGVVDWSAARLVPPGWDLAYCRADMCVLAGPDAAEGLLRHYVGVRGREPAHLAVWDLICGVNALRWSHLWVVAYAEQGAVGLTTARVKARAAAMVRRALAELS